MIFLYALQLQGMNSIYFTSASVILCEYVFSSLWFSNNPTLVINVILNQVSQLTGLFILQKDTSNIPVVSWELTKNK